MEFVDVPTILIAYDVLVLNELAPKNVLFQIRFGMGCAIPAVILRPVLV
jgi:hypothetical protein